LNSEAAVLAAVIENQDMPSLLTSGVDDLFTAHEDAFKGLKDYYFKYRALPPMDEVNARFPGLDLEPKGLATGFAIDEMRNQYAQRKMAEVIKMSAEDLRSGAGLLALEKLHERVGKLAKIAQSSRDLDVSDSAAAREHLLHVKERVEEMGGSYGIPTGLRAIDASYLTGMAPGHLVVVIGWPGRGKTWMTGYLAVKAWERGFRPMIVSLEMSPEVMRDRLYTMMGAGLFSMSDFTRGDINMDTYDNWSADYFSNKNGFIVVSNEGQGEVTPNYIQAKIDQHRPDLVIIDYHQLMSDNNRSKSPIEANRNISLELKRMALRNSIPIIDVVSATMNDISDQKAPPMLSQVAWSKAIEYDADHAMAIHRTEDEDGKTSLIEIVCRKNRHGPEYDFYVDVDLGRGIIKEVYE
jgi:replicative DNA helicase